MKDPFTGEVEPYSNFGELLKNEVEGRDFLRIYQIRHSPVAIVAPHGGGIEPGTSEIAQAIAGEEYSLYCFDSLKTNGNEIMHITSHDFDDPLCLYIAQNAQVVVSIHGCSDEDPGVFLGGLHSKLRDQVQACLLTTGFMAFLDDERHPGKHIDNVCNLGKSGAGIQLEVSLGLRRRMFAGMARLERQETRPAFDRFVSAVRKALKSSIST
jgi:phage replication-related protein YjqB (UPF0714/DUF867 family)